MPTPPPAPPETPDYTIFLDTQVFEAASFNFNTTTFVSLEEQIQKGRVRLLLTDITVQEVKARIEKTVLAQFEGFKKFKQNARVLRSSTLPDVKAALGLEKKKVIADLHQQFNEFIQRTKAEIIDTSAVPAGAVFEKYFAGKPPFGAADKKSEFPDAFVVEALAEWSVNNREQIYVVSGDQPMRDACTGHKRLYATPRLSQLLDIIVLEVAIAQFVRERTLERLDDIRQQVKTQFEDRMYSVDDEWGDAEMRVDSLELQGEPEIIEADDHSATLEARFNATFTAHLSYDDSSTGFYDNETKSMMFMEHRHEEQDKHEEFVVEVKVKFEIFDPDSFKIEDITLVEPDESYSVSTSRSEE
jgi:hypothetical protein